MAPRPYSRRQGKRSSAALESTLFPNGTAVPGAELPGGRGAAGLYGLFWQLRGGECSVKTGFGLSDSGGGSRRGGGGGKGGGGGGGGGRPRAPDLGIGGLPSTGAAMRGEEVRFENRASGLGGGGMLEGADLPSAGPAVRGRQLRDRGRVPVLGGVGEQQSASAAAGDWEGQSVGCTLALRGNDSQVLILGM